MVDLFALLVTHGLIALAVLRLLARADLDADPATPRDPPRRVKKLRGQPAAPVRREMILPNQPRPDPDLGANPAPNTDAGGAGL